MTISFSGGGAGAASQEQATLAQMEAQQVALNNMQAQQQAGYAAADAAVQKSVADQFASATGQTPAGQAASQLGILDYINTTPEGLSNSPKTGSLRLLGN